MLQLVDHRHYRADEVIIAAVYSCVYSSPSSRSHRVPSRNQSRTSASLPFSVTRHHNGNARGARWYSVSGCSFQLPRVRGVVGHGVFHHGATRAT